MAETERPQLYLITPPEVELSTFPDSLARVLDAAEIACVRLELSSSDEDRIARTADGLRAVCHERDVAIVIDTHVRLVERLGLDGVHLSQKAASIRSLREDLGEDAIIGAFCGNSRHDGLSAGEAGADYVSFGPVGRTALGTGTQAETDLFAWWSEVIEIPVVAEGALSVEKISEIAAYTDFFAFGQEIWKCPDPAAELARLIAAMD
ncbi:thiamine phosphate synthase [Brevirhabdus sp.]|uniref:thiamine phosphate synthase n=1 Tax=Brevirhabdus sp. TaxID=2004514 RepID=UPI004059BB8A